MLVDVCCRYKNGGCIEAIKLMCGGCTSAVRGAVHYFIRFSSHRER